MKTELLSLYVVEAVDAEGYALDLDIPSTIYHVGAKVEESTEIYKVGHGEV